RARRVAAAAASPEGDRHNGHGYESENRTTSELHHLSFLALVPILCLASITPERSPGIDLASRLVDLVVAGSRSASMAPQKRGLIWSGASGIPHCEKSLCAQPGPRFTQSARRSAAIVCDNRTMIGQAGRGRRIGVLLIAMGLLALASAPAALGADRVYWANGDNNTISYANLDGSGGGGELNLSGATPSGPHGIAIDPATGRLYVANQGDATTSYGNVGGGGGGGHLKIAGATASKPPAAAIGPAAGNFFCADDNNTISYANLDGSGGGQLDISGATPNAP